jgi:hypothetical protein
MPRQYTRKRVAPVGSDHEYIDINQDFSSSGDDVPTAPEPAGLHIAFVDPKATNEELRNVGIYSDSFCSQVLIVCTVGLDKNTARSRQSQARP